ncbi:TauD/TfdA family dioxygenase [Glutamicibacter sp. JL.03c]|uniref:TauD/TfdA dioxygenase family protein n=1 Tax=Glutamicibacter sp. JL.03c TaxID=2984842 RepID=UPI0021F79657|nr:TauD/TfdA family dioxygenase [Glutamicibacter sp. JL.03c]UYQ76078.1 TauD/TfdA family dioxygenase [Glutamicibacter sp. JL.03c]
MSTTAATRLHVTKLGEHIGARIDGLDLTGALSPDTVSAIREALNEHKALVFSQSGIISEEQQEIFAAHFGPLTTAHPR